MANEWFHEARLMLRGHQICVTEHLKIYFIELPKLQKSLEEANEKEGWALFIKEGEKMTHSQIAVHHPELEKVWMELQRLSGRPELREQYEAKLKWWRDQVSRIESAHEEGLEKGWEKGWEKGREKGREEGREKGREEGREEGLILALTRQLKIRFPRMKVETLPWEQLSIEQLEELTGYLLKAKNAAQFRKKAKELAKMHVSAHK